MSSRTISTWLSARPWIWVFIAAFAVWMFMAFAVSGRGMSGVLAIALQFATFYVIIGLGQMLVIATGPGNIDLSIPSVMTLSAYLAMGMMGGSDTHLMLGLAAGIGTGLAAGIGNVLLILLLRIPPMIATLASGFIIYSMAIAYSSGSTAQPAPALAEFASTRVAGVPLIALCFIIVAILIAAVVYFTPFGRGVLAVGQNTRGAYLAGIPLRRIRSAVFIISALAASIAGILLAAATSGASLNMGQGYLLMSIAVVVLGGTSILGGRVAVPGVWGASLLLYMIVSLLNILSVSSSIRYLTIGLVIIVVLAIGHAGEKPD